MVGREAICHRGGLVAGRRTVVRAVSAGSGPPLIRCQAGCAIADVAAQARARKPDAAADQAGRLGVFGTSSLFANAELLNRGARAVESLVDVVAVSV